MIDEEVSPKGQRQIFSWVTDIPLSEHTLPLVMKGGRARWRIENETVNTLKNQGYHFEHHFGHSNQPLSKVFAELMWLAFWVAQLQGLGCQLFQQALTTMESRVRCWERFRADFLTFKLPDWAALYQAISSLPIIELPLFDTS
jgi:hypothetical protein